MVKTGKERAEKYAAKYDLNALLLRWKALQDLSIKRFTALTFQFEMLDRILCQWFLEFGLRFGERGTLSDIVKYVIWNWEKLTDVEKEIFKKFWIMKGLPLELWERIPQTAKKLTMFYSFCSRIIGKLWSAVELTLDKEIPFLLLRIQTDKHISVVQHPILNITVEVE